MADSLRQSRYRVEGMDCPSCAMKIEAALRPMSDIEEVSVSVAAGTMSLRHRGGAELGAEVERKVRALGFELAPAADAPPSSPVHGSHDHHHHQHHHDHEPTSGPWWNSGRGRLTIACGLAVGAAWIATLLKPGLQAWIFPLAMLIGLVPIARRAATAALAGVPFSIEMLMTIAAVGAVVIGAGEEAATVVFLFLVGELLEGVAAGKARTSIRSLAGLVPKSARLEVDGGIQEVPADSLTVEAIILVRPGDRIPADGVILSGESAIDEAPVTGESTPVRKGAGGLVFAGTVNGDGALRIRVTAAAADNTIARVVRLVEEARESKAPTERLIERFSRYYTPVIVGAAAAVALLPPLLSGQGWDDWIYKGLAILLIGCPCALVISTPAAVAASLSAGARRGLLVKGGAVLESIGKVTAVALDKTGTLTGGRPLVTDIVGFGCPEKEVLRLAAALESSSNHPLAKAILDRAVAEQVDVSSVADGKAVGGKGVTGTVDGKQIFLGSPLAAADLSALDADQMARIADLNEQGKTVSVLVSGTKALGLLAMRDEPRPDAAEGLKALTDAGIKTVMLTGDNRRTAEAIGRQLGIDVHAELLPEDKRRIIGELRGHGYRVAKVGDGINDAPALAAADVGVAMGGGTDVALETADAAVLHGRVGDVARMIALSRRTMRNIRQNITIALGLKAVFLVTTMVGMTGLWPAILADTGATVLVTINALRLLRFGL